MHFKISSFLTLPLNTDQAEIQYRPFLSLICYIKVKFIACPAVKKFQWSYLIHFICEWLHHCILLYLDSARVINHHLLIKFHARVYFRNNFSPTWNFHYQNSNKDKHLVTFDVGKNKPIGFYHYFFLKQKVYLKRVTSILYILKAV